MKFERSKHLLSALGAISLALSLAGAAVEAQVPANIEAGLVAMGHIVDPPCTAKLYRPLMPANDITQQRVAVVSGHHGGA